MLFKSANFEIKADSQDDTEFEGYASFFDNTDSYGDIIERGAFKKTIKENIKRIKILWQHNIMEPIGLPKYLEEDTKGLYVQGKLSLTDTGKKAITLIKDGVISEMSIGFDTIKEEPQTRDGKRVNVIKEVRLWEFSPVTFGANDKAKILKFYELLESTKNDRIMIETAIKNLQLLLENEPVKATHDEQPIDEDMQQILKIVKNLRRG